MNKIDSAVSELREMDALMAVNSPVHSLNPGAKLLTTIAYILFTVSYDKYDLSGLFIMILYPVLMFQLSGVSFKACLYKMRLVLPLVCAVGVFNPLLDRETILYLGHIAVSGGVMSMITLMLKGVLCLTASFILASTTGIDSICASLRKIKVPGMLVTLLLLTYRYIDVMINEVSVMTEAYTLRAPGQKGIHISAWGSFLGQLLLRSMDRAEELYSSMQLRGFCGEFHYAEAENAKGRDYAFCIVCIALFSLCRYYNIPQILGQLIV